MSKDMYLFLSLLLIVSECCHAYLSRTCVQTPRSTTQTFQRNSFVLQAKLKKTSKSKTKPTSKAGGFGSSAYLPKKTNTNQKPSADDYALFPALEPNVKDTLIRTDDTMPGGQQTAGELPNEIYQRLGQIYGFPNFNYETTTKEEESSVPMSFEEMLSGSALMENDEETNSSDNNLPISNLPPFDKFQVLHVDPLVLQVDDFFTPQECEAYVAMTTSGQTDVYQTGSLTVGKDKDSQAQRTSTTWFNHYKNVPALMAKASRLLGLDGIDQWEEPQTVRYRKSEKFTWHLDALGPQELTSSKGGQRTATLLVYHTDLDETDGGATVFRDLKDESGDRLKMRPKKGSALLFFPAAGGIPNTPLDIRTLHCGEMVAKDSSSDKWISQIWLRQTPNAYIPTAPQGNSHEAATSAITDYCQT